MRHSSAKAQMHIWPFIHMNLDEDHDEHNNILKYFILPRISSESWWVLWHVAQDYWSLSNGYKGSRNSINRDQGLNITHTFAKHTRKQLKSVWSLANTLISQRSQEVFKSVHQYFSYLFKDKSLPPFFSCLIQIIQTPYKL